MKLITLFFSTSLFMNSAMAKDISLEPVASVPRMFGNQIHEAETLKAFQKNQQSNSFTYQSKDLRLAFPLGELSPQVTDVTSFKPVVAASGDMVQTKGIYPGRGFMYIADTGKDGKHSEPGKVWRFDPKTGSLVKFYESKSLITPKWLFYYAGETPEDDRVIVADLGEEPVPRNPGTGVGAKVISIPILANGTAGTVKVLHEGAPFRSPEGVTVIGKTIIVSDWSAGTETTRAEAPDDPYLQGKVFALPLEGGAPKVLFPDHKWVTIIGACQFRDNKGRLFLRLIDIDGGRLQAVEPTFPRSGLVKYFISEVISEEPLVLASLQEQVLFEDVPISVPAHVLGAAASYEISLLNGSMFQDLTNRKTFKASDKSFVVKSPITEDKVKFEATLLGADGKPLSVDTVSVPKLQDGGAVPLDNKHAGSSRQRLSAPGTVLSGSADGTSRSLFIFPPKGGTPAVLWRGAPFNQPMGVQFSDDGKKVYVTDQAAGTAGKSVLFELTMPSEFELDQMFDKRFQ